ncbi:MAG: Isochorismatase [Verrucomicrobiaceae bacterium]|nr:Isochorismatase [Verrucomicrobiaceae bacterium]
MHGCVPDSSPVALLLIDVINDMEFPGGDKLLRHALPAAQKILKLKEQARKHGIPSIYVNDNFGRWRSDFHQQVDRCLGEDLRGSEIARMLVPREEDYFVLKPKHSAFHYTTLDVLFKHVGATTLIITGFA